MSDGIVNNPGPRHADVYDGFGFADAMKSSGHEGIVFNRIRKAHELCAGDAAFTAGALGGFLDDDSHLPHRVHVYARPRCRDVD